MEFLMPTQEDLDKYDAYMWNEYKNIITASIQSANLRRHFNGLLDSCTDDQVLLAEFKNEETETVEQINDFYDYYTFIRNVSEQTPKGEYGEANFLLASPEPEE